MKTLLILFILINVDKLLKPGECTEARDLILSVTPKTQEQVDLLKNVSTQHEIVLWHPGSPDFITNETEVQLFVPANSSETVRDLLQRHAMTYTVLLYNTKELIEIQMRNDSADPRSNSTFYERYHSLEDIYHWINRTQQDNPDTLKTIFIGSSYEKRPLYALKMSLNSRPNKTAMWIDCGIHAREWISPAFCLWFIHYSLSSYKINQDITNILDNMDVYILPVMNPDGYKFTWTGIQNRMWRKNRSRSKDGKCIGVDLNRNFDANWCAVGASSDPCRDIYCGEYPESEPESQAVANFLRSHKDTIQLYIGIHSYLQMLIFPNSDTHEQVENYNDLYEMVQEAAQNIRKDYGSDYKYGAGSKILGLASGGSDDWAYSLGIKYSFTLELRDRTHHFLLPQSDIARACREALTALKTIALKVIEKTQAPASPPQAA